MRYAEIHVARSVVVIEGIGACQRGALTGQHRSSFVERFHVARPRGQRGLQADDDGLIIFLMHAVNAHVVCLFLIAGLDTDVGIRLVVRDHDLKRRHAIGDRIIQDLGSRGDGCARVERGGLAHRNGKGDVGLGLIVFADRNSRARRSGDAVVAAGMDRRIERVHYTIGIPVNEISADIDNCRRLGDRTVEGVKAAVLC